MFEGPGEVGGEIRSRGILVVGLVLIARIYCMWIARFSRARKQLECKKILSRIEHATG